MSYFFYLRDVYTGDHALKLFRNLPKSTIRMLTFDLNIDESTDFNIFLPRSIKLKLGTPSNVPDSRFRIPFCLKIEGHDETTMVYSNLYGRVLRKSYNS